MPPPPPDQGAKMLKRCRGQGLHLGAPPRNSAGDCLPGRFWGRLENEGHLQAFLGECIANAACGA